MYLATVTCCLLLLGCCNNPLAGDIHNAVGSNSAKQPEPVTIEHSAAKAVDSRMVQAQFPAYTAVAGMPLEVSQTFVALDSVRAELGRFQDTLLVEETGVRATPNGEVFIRGGRAGETTICYPWSTPSPLDHLKSSPFDVDQSSPPPPGGN